jgi:hypothetical protein
MEAPCTEKKKRRLCHNTRFYWPRFTDAGGNLRQRTNQLTNSTAAEPKTSTPKSSSPVFITCFPSFSVLLFNLLGFPWGYILERFHHQNSARISRFPHISHISNPSCISISYHLNSTKWTPFQTHYFSEIPVAPGIESGTSGSVARNSDY